MSDGVTVVRVGRGDWGIRFADGVVANGFPTREDAEREIVRGAEWRRKCQRDEAILHALTNSPEVKIGEVLAAFGQGWQAVEQLAAQHGLLMPDGTGAGGGT